MAKRVGARRRTYFQKQVEKARAERAKGPAPPAANGRYWWQEKDEEPTVTESIEPPRPAPYDGEPFKVTAEGLDGVRRLWAWTRKPMAEALAQYGPAIRAAGCHAFYENVRNRRTGDLTPPSS